MQTHLGKVRGLGSAKSGTEHWWMQRVTAIALVPLSVWLLVSLVGLVGAGHATVVGWIANPMVTVLLILFASVTAWHMKLGLQVVIEDYVHSEGAKILALMLVNFAAAVIGLAAVVSVLKISFGS